MAEEIIKKKYYRIKFELVSPLAVGSGMNISTDKDIVRDGRGVPYIPGSALAGSARSILKKYELNDHKGQEKSEECSIDDSSWLQYYMGDVKLASDSDNNVWSRESRIVFYDASMCEEDIDNCIILKRDGVGLDEWKTARKGAKYDFEIVEPGVKFVTLIEQNIYYDSEMQPGKIDAPVADLIVKEWRDNTVFLGAKNSRGNGAIKTLTIQTKEFLFNNEESEREYALFDPFSKEDWVKSNPFVCDDEMDKMMPGAEEKYSVKLCLNLNLNGSILIRKYSTKVEAGKTMPDFSQLYILKEGNKELPVIPGTTWAGAFKAQMEKLIPGVTEDYFGVVDPKEKIKKKSKIRFSESQLEGSKPKQISRNAIDRFSGGTIDEALFTEKSWYGGSTILEISFGKDTSSEFDSVLAAAIVDLNNGFMAVGGATSVGRGRFVVTEINGKKMSTDTLYADVLSEIKMMKGGMENGGN